MPAKTIILPFFFLLFITTAAQDLSKLSPSNRAEVLKADSLDLLARKLMLKLKYDSAKYYLDEATAIAKKTGENNIIARCYIDYANMYFLLSKVKLAEQYMKMANPYLERADNYDVKINGILLWAHLYNALDKKDSAMWYYHQAENYNNEKIPYRNWVVYTAIGEMYNQADDFESAERYFLKAYNLTVKQEDKPDHIHLLTVFLNFYLSKNKPADAGPLIEEYDLVVEERKRRGVTDPLQDILLSVTGSRLTSNPAFMRSVKEKSLENGMLHQAMIANSYLIDNYQKKKQYDEALKSASENEELAVKTGSIQHIYKARRIKFSLLQKAGKHAEANILAEDLFVLKDSMLTLQKRTQLYELETKYETEKKQGEIELLSSRNTLKEKEIALLLSDKRMNALLLQQEIMQRSALGRENLLMDSIVKKEQAYSQAVSKEKEKQSALSEALGRENDLKAVQLVKERNTKWMLAGGGALVLLSGIIILGQYRRQKKKNSIIQKQATDLEVLMKEIHHRVKNNLQIVSSLLDLQSHSITDAQAHEAVKEGKNRVQSMALIHQNLYSEGNIKGIKIKEYVANLLQTLCDSYNVTNDNVKINLDIDDLNLDVDTVIPLGLVLNELVSNSFKYAFNKNNNGELNILLKEQAGELHLLVSDNGSGFPEGMDVRNNKSFGLKMIRAFAQKLKAKLNIYNNNGAVVEMKITKYKMG